MVPYRISSIRKTCINFINGFLPSTLSYYVVYDTLSDQTNFYVQIFKITFFPELTKTVFIVSFLKFHNFPMEVMAQRTDEKKVVAAKNIAIFVGKLRLFCIKTKVSFWPLFIMQSLHRFCAKMVIFLAATNFFSPVLWAMNSMEKL